MSNQPVVKRSVLSKVAAISAVGAALGFGTCGLGFINLNGLGDAIPSFMVSAGLILFFVSLATLVVTALIAFGIAFTKSVRNC